MEQPRIVTVGGNPLNGEIEIEGAKNFALNLPLTILAPGSYRIAGVPKLVDMRVCLEILGELGARYEWENGELNLDTSDLRSARPSDELASRMRASILCMGPLLARLGEAVLPLPGGCTIGARPIDYHIKGFRAMNCQVKIYHGAVWARTSGLRGAEISFDFPSVGATENLMMAATVAEGETVINNAAQEPEVTGLARILKQMGAEIEGEGTSRLSIRGVKELRPIDFSILPDRIVAGTFLLGVAATGGDVKLRNIQPEFIMSAVSKLKSMGAEIEIGKDFLRVMGEGGLSGAEVMTAPYPGFPTDLQAQMMTLLSVCKGKSQVTETVFENRFLHVDELNKMGAEIKVKGSTARINGVSRLSGASVRGKDLRATAGLVIAGLVAEGESTIYGMNDLDRGYVDFAGKLAALGADLKRIDP